jgi:hypothetical protein
MAARVADTTITATTMITVRNTAVRAAIRTARREADRVPVTKTG